MSLSVLVLSLSTLCPWPCSWLVVKLLPTVQWHESVDTPTISIGSVAMLGMLGRAGLWILLLRLQAGAGNAGAVDDECGHESGQSCTLQMLQHVAERRLRSYGPMRPDPSVVRWHQVPSGGRLITGTLSVFLDPADAKSPQLELEISIYFSDQQPAPLGPLLLHCGGPGSDSSCLRYATGKKI